MASIKTEENNLNKAKQTFDLGILEEDDDFEEFPVDDWAVKGDDTEEISLWEDNWDDDIVEDEFSTVLSVVVMKDNEIHPGKQVTAQSLDYGASEACDLKEEEVVKESFPTGTLLHYQQHQAVSIVCTEDKLPANEVEMKPQIYYPTFQPARVGWDGQVWNLAGVDDVNYLLSDELDISTSSSSGSEMDHQSSNILTISSKKSQSSKPASSSFLNDFDEEEEDDEETKQQASDRLEHKQKLAKAIASKYRTKRLEKSGKPDSSLLQSEVSSLTPGALVWALLPYKYQLPWWPGVVIARPIKRNKTGGLVPVKRGPPKMDEGYVRFFRVLLLCSSSMPFDTGILLPPHRLRPFHGRATFEKFMCSLLGSTRNKLKALSQFAVPPKYQIFWHAARDQAEAALTWPAKVLSGRFQFLGINLSTLQLALKHEEQKRKEIALRQKREDEERATDSKKKESSTVKPVIVKKQICTHEETSKSLQCLPRDDIFAFEVLASQNHQQPVKGLFICSVCLKPGRLPIRLKDKKVATVEKSKPKPNRHGPPIALKRPLNLKTVRPALKRRLVIKSKCNEKQQGSKQSQNNALEAYPTLIPCSGRCSNFLHLQCINAAPIQSPSLASSMDSIASPQKNRLRCFYCRAGLRQCSICMAVQPISIGNADEGEEAVTDVNSQQEGNPDRQNEEDSIKVSLLPMQCCSVHLCRRWFHSTCLRQHPFAALVRDGRADSFACPAHTCMSCYADAPGNLPRPSNTFVRCFFCAATYHPGEWCVPAGSLELSSNWIICPRHALQVPPVQPGEDVYKHLLALNKSPGRVVNLENALFQFEEKDGRSGVADNANAADVHCSFPEPFKKHGFDSHVIANTGEDSVIALVDGSVPYSKSEISFKNVSMPQCNREVSPNKLISQSVKSEPGSLNFVEGSFVFTREVSATILAADSGKSEPETRRLKVNDKDTNNGLSGCVDTLSECEHEKLEESCPPANSVSEATTELFVDVSCKKAPNALMKGNTEIKTVNLELPFNKIVLSEIHRSKLGGMFRPANVSWCFICSKGGHIICCESCPASFHQECLKVDEVPEQFLCEDCINGRMPRYGEIVWARLPPTWHAAVRTRAEGLSSVLCLLRYAFPPPDCVELLLGMRWWPAEILHDRNLRPLEDVEDRSPSLASSPLTHPTRLGFFPVRLFGLYSTIPFNAVPMTIEKDQGATAVTENFDETLEFDSKTNFPVCLWTTKARVFPYEEGDDDRQDSDASDESDTDDSFSGQLSDASMAEEDPMMNQSVTGNESLLSPVLPTPSVGRTSFTTSPAACGVSPNTGGSRLRRRPPPSTSSSSMKRRLSESGVVAPSATKRRRGRGNVTAAARRRKSVYRAAVKRAALGWQLRKEKFTKHLGLTRRPAYYKPIKVNYPIGTVRLYRYTDMSEVLQCECKAAHDIEPCGPNSGCINRELLYECVTSVCVHGEACRNQRFTRREYPPQRPFWTGDERGWGLKTLVPITKGDFVNEYIGDLIDEEEANRRLRFAHENNITNYYMMQMDSQRIIDAGPKGNLSRFMNHSCDPNLNTQKWTVNGDTRVGLFAVRDIAAGEELTFNYNFCAHGQEMLNCRCGATSCVGYLGARPDSTSQAAAAAAAAAAAVNGSGSNVATANTNSTTSSSSSNGTIAAFMTSSGSTTTGSLFTSGITPSAGDDHQPSAVATVGTGKRGKSVSTSCSSAVSLSAAAAAAAIAKSASSLGSLATSVADRSHEADELDGNRHEKHCYRCYAIAGEGVVNTTATVGGQSPPRRRRGRRSRKRLTLDDSSSVSSNGSAAAVVPQDPLVLCDKSDCPKAYHLQCLDLDRRPTGGRWYCPWHHCDACGRPATVFCMRCPTAFCPGHVEGSVTVLPPKPDDNQFKFAQVVCLSHTDLISASAGDGSDRENGGPFSSSDGGESDSDDADEGSISAANSDQRSSCSKRSMSFVLPTKRSKESKRTAGKYLNLKNESLDIPRQCRRWKRSNDLKCVFKCQWGSEVSAHAFQLSRTRSFVPPAH